MKDKIKIDERTGNTKNIQMEILKLKNAKNKTKNSISKFNSRLAQLKRQWKQPARKIRGESVRDKIITCGKYKSTGHSTKKDYL